MCATHQYMALCLLEMTRRPMTARRLGYVRVIEHPKPETKLALNYDETEYGKMEMNRRPRAAFRFKKLKKNNINTK
jgi:hypothetical protein